jgi:hypothetical protein
VRGRASTRGHARAAFPEDQAIQRPRQWTVVPARAHVCVPVSCPNCWFERRASVSVSRSVNVAAREVWLTNGSTNLSLMLAQTMTSRQAF